MSTADVAEGAVRVALGGVVICHKAGKLAEGGAEAEVESIGVMAEVLTKEGTGRRVDGLLEKQACRRWEDEHRSTWADI